MPEEGKHVKTITFSFSKWRQSTCFYVHIGKYTYIRKLSSQRATLNWIILKERQLILVCMNQSISFNYRLKQNEKNYAACGKEGQCFQKNIRKVLALIA
jgi:hypothetical protein